MRRAVAISAIVAAGACAGEPAGSSGDGTWVGSISTEGNVTTVVNESGSVWGGTATLVEEMSIGVEAGEEPYLLGNVMGIGVVEDRVYVLDAQALLVRVYDRASGEHLADFGGEGAGPGEFRGPTGLAVGSDTVYVRDPRLGRISLFSLSGELRDTWPTMPLYTGIPIVAVVDTGLFVMEGGKMVLQGPDGSTEVAIPLPRGDARPPMMTLTITDSIAGYSAGATLAQTVPFWPRSVFAFSASEEMIHGVADEYRFKIERRGGEGITEITSSHEPVPVDPREAAWHRKRVEDYMRQGDPAWQWDAPEIPPVKPAFEEFVPAVTGVVWVVRPGPGYEDTTCEPITPMHEPPATCWKDARIVDVFGADGRLLGRVDLPPGIRVRPRPYVWRGGLIGVFQDDAGTIMVKRYRLALPGGNAQ